MKKIKCCEYSQYALSAVQQFLAMGRWENRV
jgi:hypothetical protein